MNNLFLLTGNYANFIDPAINPPSLFLIILGSVFLALIIKFIEERYKRNKQKSNEKRKV